MIDACVQSLPSFGPYLQQRTEAIAKYKKHLRGAGETDEQANVSRVITPKKPVPAVKVWPTLSLRTRLID